MTEYEQEHQAELVNRYNSLVARRNAAAEEHNRLVYEVQECQTDVYNGLNIISKLKSAVVPPLDSTAQNTDKERVIAENVSRTLDDLAESYSMLKTGSTASKNLYDDMEKYETKYGFYKTLRRIALGYIIGFDANLWTSDEPRELVEKTYLANTDYWLAYAAMAVTLWVSDEKEACERAVSQSMQINERKSALFYLLASLRFNRIESAKQWYEVYFGLVDADGVGDEIIYILQVLLCGALGSDAEFAKAVYNRMRELLKQARDDVKAGKDVRESVDNYFNAFLSVTDKEYLALKHICADYPEMIDMLSCAEKNAKLRDYFSGVINDGTELSDRLAERIEDALHSLISSNDDAEQMLLDKIRYEEMVVKANGNIAEAKKSYESYAMERDRTRNMTLIMLNAVLDVKSKADPRVKKFAFDFVRSDCIQGAERFSSYRKKEKKEYDFQIEDCKMRGDENSFETNKPVLLKYYDGLVKNSIKADKAVKSLKAFIAGGFGAFALFTVLTVLGFIGSWGTGPCVTFIALAVLSAGAFAMCIYFLQAEKAKIRKSFEYRINNGLKMLEDGLAGLASWRSDYHTADSVHAELINVLKEAKNG